MSKETLKKELKSTEEEAKDKILKVVLDDFVDALKVKDKLYDRELVNRNLENPELYDAWGRLDAAEAYISKNYSEEYVEKFIRKNYPELAKRNDEATKEDQAKTEAIIAEYEALKAQFEDNMKEIPSPHQAFADSPYVHIESLREIMEKRDFEKGIRSTILEKNMDKLEEDVYLKPYNQRLQNLIKERTGR